jgi:hypothetical protein
MKECDPHAVKAAIEGSEVSGRALRGNTHSADRV